MSYVFKSEDLQKQLERFGNKVGAALEMSATTKAQKIKADMKVKRPWTDRTGMAKAMLDASVSKPEKDVIRITLSQGVEYGVWLELAHEKRFAILKPTLEEEGPKVVKSLQGIIDRRAK